MRRALLGVLFAGFVAIGQAQETPPPFITVEPGALDFGEQVVGEASKSRRVTVTIMVSKASVPG